jgi:hypothetical protein
VREKVHVADPAGGAALVCTNEDYLIGNQRIAVKAGLVPVLVDIVAPPHFTAPLIESIESAGA